MCLYHCTIRTKQNRYFNLYKCNLNYFSQGKPFRHPKTYASFGRAEFFFTHEKTLMFESRKGKHYKDCKTMFMRSLLQIHQLVRS